MTGYGRAEYVQDGIEATAEVRSLNNRFLDIGIRLPKSLAHCEQQVQNIVRKNLARGRVNVSISVKGRDDRTLRLSLDEDLLRAYLQLAQNLREKFSIKGEIDIGQLLSFPDVISYEPEPVADEKYWKCAEIALIKAVESTNQMRDKEGSELAADFEQRISKLEQFINNIEDIAHNRSKDELEKLRKRVHTLLNTQQTDEARLELELAIMADRLDVTEECVRFHSHNKLFKDTMRNGSAPGRQLTFLLQEMNREANTIGAKANCAEISHLVVKIKEEVERIREQVQNIE